MKERSDLRNQLRATRQRLRISQQELADAAGVARQTVGGIEAELYAPSAAVALRLARALGCTVEELFWLEGRRETITAQAAASVPHDTRVRVAIGRVGEQWVAHSLDGELAFRAEMIPADGEGVRSAGSSSFSVELVDDSEALARTVILAGCAPGLSLWARSAERWFPGLRVHWIGANSTSGLRSLRDREVHAAGIHLYDAATGESNVSSVRKELPNLNVSLVSLGAWREGFVVPAGNPKEIRDVQSLQSLRARIVNRERGSGARLLLDHLLVSAGVDGKTIEGYRDEVTTHQEAARRVLDGSADAAVSTSAVAEAYGLEFVDLQLVRYDVAILDEYLEQEPVRQLLSTLQHRWVRKQLNMLGGFDTQSTGEIVHVAGGAR